MTTYVSTNTILFIIISLSLSPCTSQIMSNWMNRNNSQTMDSSDQFGYIWDLKSEFTSRDNLLESIKHTQSAEQAYEEHEALYARQRERDAIYWTETIVPRNSFGRIEKLKYAMTGKDPHHSFKKIRVLNRLFFFMAFNYEHHFVSDQPNGALLEPSQTPYQMIIGVKENATKEGKLLRNIKKAYKIF